MFASRIHRRCWNWLEPGGGSDVDDIALPSRQHTLDHCMGDPDYPVHIGFYGVQPVFQQAIVKILPAAYVWEDGEIVLASPPTLGYRLPTEAAWAWAAR